MQEQDRRAAGIARVPVERVVEICGREPGIPAFEAESVELSGRGMHVRTPYLPELDAPLVCRLEDDGREIVVEGVVAWRNQTETGGEFGIRFTALDSSSVGVLRALCELGVEVDEGEPDPTRDPDDEEALAFSDEPGSELSPPPPLATPGHAVKLHIDGLGSPMKARVRRGSKRRVHVGSNLEFLKVGRNLQIEDLGSAERLGAMIDAVTVAVDPQTDVPQLVVTLRYEGAEDVTPSPSVVDAQVAEKPGGSEKPAVVVAPRSRPAPEALEDEADADDELDDDDIDRFVQHSALKERLEGFATRAGQAARVTSSVLARVSASTMTGMGALAERAGKKVADVRQGRAKKAPRRTTARAPHGATTSAQRLRPQSGAKRGATEAPPDPNNRRKKIALVSAGLGIVLAGTAMVLSAGSKEESTAASAPSAEAPPAVAAAPADAIQPPAMKVTAAAPAAAPKGPAKNEQGIVADVPLFGATPMATMEPAPLEPPEDDIAESAGSDVPDESFDAPSPAQESQKKQMSWGNGRLHLPFVHRMKLDEPADKLEGAKRSTGFTVFLPKRKLLETGKAIARRDDRIIEVRTSNEPRGARVTFVFQGKVPSYKVRLKGDHIEFFVSSPEGR